MRNREPEPDPVDDEELAEYMRANPNASRAEFLNTRLQMGPQGLGFSDTKRRIDEIGRKELGG